VSAEKVTTEKPKKGAKLRRWFVAFLVLFVGGIWLVLSMDLAPVLTDRIASYVKQRHATPSQQFAQEHARRRPDRRGEIPPIQDQGNALPSALTDPSQSSLLPKAMSESYDEGAPADPLAQGPAEDKAIDLAALAQPEEPPIAEDIPPQGVEAQGRKSNHLAAQVAALQQEIARLRTQQSPEATPPPGQDYALLVSLWQLRDALDAGQSPRYAIAAMKKLLLQSRRPQDQAMRETLMQLEAMTHAGLMSVTELRQEFVSMASELAQAVTREDQGKAEENMWQRWLAQMVRVRRTDGTKDADAVDGLILALEQALERHDLEVASHTAAQIRQRASGHASQPVFGRYLRWEEGLQQRVKARTLIQQLFQQILGEA